MCNNRSSTTNDAKDITPPGLQLREKGDDVVLLHLLAPIPHMPNGDICQKHRGNNEALPLLFCWAHLENDRYHGVIFLKSATFLKRQKCSVCMQIVIPLVLVILLGLIQIFVKHQMANLGPTIYMDSHRISVDNDTIIYFGQMFETNPNNIEGIGAANANGTGSGLLGNMFRAQVPIPMLNETIWLPRSIEYSSQKEMMSAVANVKSELINARRSTAGLTKDALTKMPFSAITFNAFNALTQIFDYQMSIETQLMFQYMNVSDPFIYMITMNELESAYIKTVYNQSYIINANLYEFPFAITTPKIDIGSLLGGLFYPFALSFLLPLFVFSIVIEKQERLRDMMLMMGLRMRNYWIVTYLFNFLLYAFALVIVVGVSIIFKFSVFTEGSGFAMFLLLFGWGNAMITFSFFLSTLFQRTRTATIFCYFLLIISVIVNLVLSAVMFADTPPPAAYYWYPLFAFYRGLTIVSTLCGIDLCPKWSEWNWDFEPSRIIFWLYMDAVFFLVLALYLDQVLPREFGVPSHPLFFMEPVVNWFRTKTARTKRPDEQFLINGTQNDYQMDDDVQHEMSRIQNHEYNANSPIIIENLTKHYDGRPKPALDGLFLTIESGECFGLLGPNGAGKTTTISLLTGLYRPTSGVARVGGFDIATQMDYVHRIVGVCPQFDTLWEDLSCVETLLFYARLKGVPIPEEMSHVHDTLRDVALFEFKDRLVKELSGGMKRRLSVAVSIIGHSKIIFLDEPTTGLDPKTRRDLWAILNRIKKGKCLILTTHSMEEADVLSTRIGIMSQGHLHALGPQQHLKSKFGEGYALKLNIEERYIAQVDATALITRFNNGATLVECFSGSYVFRLPKDTLISELFSFMVANKEANHITEWGIQQTSLEDVFLKISEGDDTVN
eukprot:gene15460-18343_t